LPLALTLFALCAAPASAQSKELNRRERGDLAIHARAILRHHCFECHGGNRKVSTLPILEHKKLIATSNPVPFVASKKVAESQIIQFIEDGSMPPGNRDRLTSAEIDRLKEWIAEGAPSFPTTFDDAGTLQAILTDLAAQPDASKEHLRYFSFAHLISDKGPLPDLKKAEFELGRALREVGLIDLQNPPPPPQPVDDTATLFRFDVRTVGWDNRQLFTTSVNGAVGSPHQLSAYDLLLLEYPFGSLPADPRFADYFARAKLVRPIPFLRAEWVSRALMNPKSEKHEPTPLAADLKSLTALSAALKKQDFPAVGQEEKMPCGVRPLAFGRQTSVPAAVKPTTPSPILPFDSWYSGDVSMDPSPLNVAAELVTPEGQALTSVTAGQRFHLKVKAKQNAWFVLLMVDGQGGVRVMPTNRDRFFNAEQIILTPKPMQSGDLPAFSISPTTEDKKPIEYFVLLVAESGEPLPAVSIVQSRHSQGPDCYKENLFPIFRFLFDQQKTEKFDPSKVVRKVIPIQLRQKSE